MRKLCIALRIITGALVSLAGLAFTVIEATLLVTGDFALFENQALAFLQLALRITIAFAVLALGVFSLVKPTRTLLIESVCLFAVTLVMIPFISNGVGLYIAALATLFLLSEILGKVFSRK